MIRKATSLDISRIAEIIVFSKRMAYRLLLNDDALEFNSLQVLPVAKDLCAEGALENIYVFDDGIVKGMIKASFEEESMIISDFYVDPFFQQNGIGTELIDFVIDNAKEKSCKEIRLYVFKGNDSVVEFYRNFGFEEDGSEIVDFRTKKTLTGFLKVL